MCFKKVAQIISLFAIIILWVSALLRPSFAADAITTRYNTVCGTKFDSSPGYSQFYKDLQNAQQYDLQNPQNGNSGATPQDNRSDLTQAGCPPALQDIELIVTKLILIIITLVGIIVFFNLIKNSIQYMTAGPNKDKIKAARGGLQSTFMGIAIILISYSLIIFLAVRIGLAGDPDKFSFFDGTRLIFKFIFN